MFELSEIKKLRMKLGLTQTQLAQHAKVSQSLIAKIESGKIDPSYGNARKLLDTLAILDKKNECIARELMHKRIINANYDESLKSAITKMRKNKISQMPVVKNNKIVGYISESILLDRIIEGDIQKKVKEVMEDSPPIIPPTTPQSIIANLLRYFPFVLVEEKGELLGIVTKADLLKVVWD